MPQLPVFIINGMALGGEMANRAVRRIGPVLNLSGITGLDDVFIRRYNLAAVIGVNTLQEFRKWGVPCAGSSPNKANICFDQTPF